MTFTEIFFLAFLLIVLGAQAVLPGSRSRVGFLLFASYVFYGWWNVSFLLLILFSSTVDYAIGWGLSVARSTWGRRSLLSLSLIANLGLLGYFKYANFFVVTGAGFGMWLGWVDEVPPAMDIILPVGISFYTFQTLSYTIDVYRGQLAPEKNPINFFFFVAAFPQLVAGPIVRARDLLPQIQEDFIRKRDDTGVFLIAYGLAKKLLLADLIGAYLVDPTFAQAGQMSAGRLWLAAYGYAFQIFLDFSAYTDIAIGTGRLLGFRFPTNFRAPYLADSVGAFWRRWHISLTSWFRDYVYIPLGGNRTNPGRWGFAVLAVFLLSGLWHGANLTFVVWGGAHGVIFIVERIASRKWGKDSFRNLGPLHPLRWLKTAVTFHIVTVLWIAFRAPDFTVARVYVERWLTGAEGTGMDLTPGIWAALLVSPLLHLLIEPRVDAVAYRFSRWPAAVQALALIGLGTVCFGLVDQHMSHRAFIYFQF